MGILMQEDINRNKEDQSKNQSIGRRHTIKTIYRRLRHTIKTTNRKGKTTTGQKKVTAKIVEKVWMTSTIEYQTTKTYTAPRNTDLSLGTYYSLFVSFNFCFMFLN